jgi:hypothetical protein
MDLKEALSYSLSDTDIKKYLNNKTKIIRYPDLKKYNNIDDLLYPYNHVFLLYLTAPNYGHWTLIFKHTPTEIHFFDSYGYKPDDEFKFINNDFREVSDQIYKKIVDMLFNSTYNVSYNHFQLQGRSTEKRKVSTCGRWCVGRWLNHNLDEYEFHDLFSNKGINKDELISLYIK